MPGYVFFSTEATGSSVDVPTVLKHSLNSQIWCLQSSCHLLIPLLDLNLLQGTFLLRLETHQYLLQTQYVDNCHPNSSKRISSLQVTFP